MFRFAHLALVAVFMLVGFAGFVTTAEAAVNLLDNGGANWSAATSNTGGQTAHAYTAPAGDDRAVVVFIAGESAGIAASSVTVGGQAATLIGQVNGGNSYVGAYYCLIGSSASTTAANIAITWGTAPTTDTTINAATYSGVLQVVGTGAGAAINTSGTVGNAANATVTITGISNQAGGRVIVHINENGTVNSGLVTSSAWTFAEMWRLAASSNVNEVQNSTTTTAATNITLSHTITGGRGTVVAYALNPAPTDSTPPTPGTVTVTPESGIYVPADFSISTSFTDADSAVSACEYTTNGSTWVAGTVSGAGPYTCSASVTGASGGLTVNMRATSAGGTGTATAINRNVDATAPTGGTLSAIAGNALIDLSWTAASDAGAGLDGSNPYKLVRATGGTAPADCSGGAVYQGALTAFQDSGLTNGTTYSYRLCAYDAFGNVSAGTTSSATPSACVDGTVGTINVPGSQAVSGSSVDLTALYTLGGSPNFSGYTYTINGGSVTTPWNSSAFGTAGPEAVTFEVTGNDPDCGGSIVVASNTITVNNALGTAAGTAVVTSGDEQIGVLAPYSGDLNASNQLKIEWDLEGGAWSGVNYGTVTLAHAASPYSYIITPLVNQTSYQVRLTYLDTVGGVTGSAVQVFNNVIPTNPLLHNSVNTGSGKWGGLWGVTGGKYGRFTCATCHVKNTTNIKRVKTSVAAPNPLPSNFPGSAQTIVFTSAVDGSSDFGSPAAGAHATSNKICEACHTYDATQANGVKQHAYNQGASVGHYDGGDCVKCHEHKQGFKASCTGCHGNPPLVSAELTATLDPANSTGSLTAGKHDLHVNTLLLGCNTCHTGWETNGEMPKSGNINIGFNIVLGATTDTTGTYDGRTVASGASYTAPVGTTVNQGGTLTCSAIYCHGSASPEWSDAGTAVCGSCHGDATGAPLEVAGDGDLSGLTIGTKVGKHATHLQESTNKTGNACNLCHNGATHVNGGGAEVLFAPAAGTVTYVGGSCLTNSCHGDAVWNTDASGGCNFCHGYPPTSAADAANNKHASGVTAVNHDKLSAGGVVANHDDCSYCHGVKGNSGVTSTTAVILDPLTLKGLASKTYVWATDHRDGKVTMNGDTDANTTNDAGYSTTNAGCGTAACHANDATHQLTTGGAALVTKKDFGPGACATCHGDATKAATVPQVGAASSHVKVTKVAAYGDCTDCHAGHTTATGGVDIPNNATVGINYSTAGHAGIQLGGTGTNAAISALTTEAQICWACHDLAANVISEWGVNQKAATGSSPYNYGTLTTSNWTTASWSSSRSQFGYKTGAIQSTHTANPAKTYPSTGDTLTANAGGGFTETRNDVRDIRCSYCHDVHELAKAAGDTKVGTPYLRGTWMGNPYEEDGAPRNGAGNNVATAAAGAFGNDNNWGSVPRAAVGMTYLGGFFIDQNNVVPMSSTSTSLGTAANNPTGTWTLASSAGLCTMCHNTNVDGMDEKTGEALWVGTNGHSNAVIGGTGSAAVNIYDARGGSTGNNPYAHYSGWATDPGRSNQGFRTNATGTMLTNGLPKVGTATASGTGTTRPYKYKTLTGGFELATPAVEVAGQTTAQSQFHKFSCSKCHNPHASRLPKLMITNCLDTKHNTWDNQYPTVNTTNNVNVTLSNLTSAQNCHRLTGDDPDNAGDARGHLDAGAGYSGKGWNKVTPW